MNIDDDLGEGPKPRGEWFMLTVFASAGAVLVFAVVGIVAVFS